MGVEVPLVRARVRGGVLLQSGAGGGVWVWVWRVNLLTF